MASVQISWCHGLAQKDRLAAFFAKNITLSYISHSELQSGRALTETGWNPDIQLMFREEMAERLILPPGSNTRIVSAELDQVLVGLAYVTFAKDVPRPYIIVEDIVVDQERRGSGLGQIILDWIFDAARKEGIVRAFLESGKDNEDAHHFFERNGFHQVSIVMMADLEKPQLAGAE